MAKKKLNAKGHILVTEWLGKNWYRDDDGRITDEKGDYAGDKLNKVLNEQFPQVAKDNLDTFPPKKAIPVPPPQTEKPKSEPPPSAEEKKKKEKEKKSFGESAASFTGKASRKALESMFPNMYGNVASIVKMWKESTEIGRAHV